MKTLQRALRRGEKAVADLAKLGLISDSFMCGKCVFPACGARRGPIAAFCARRYKFATQKLPPARLAAFLLSNFHWQSLISTRGTHNTHTHRSLIQKTCGFGTFCHTWLAAKVCPLRERLRVENTLRRARITFFSTSFFSRNFCVFSQCKLFPPKMTRARVQF